MTVITRIEDKNTRLAPELPESETCEGSANVETVTHNGKGEAKRWTKNELKEGKQDSAGGVGWGRGDGWVVMVVVY